MYKEYDVVKAAKNLQKDTVTKGMEGTILIVYESNPIEYEVEFVDNKNESIAVLTVSENEIESM